LGHEHDSAGESSRCKRNPTNQHNGMSMHANQMPTRGLPKKSRCHRFSQNFFSRPPRLTEEKQNALPLRNHPCCCGLSEKARKFRFDVLSASCHHNRSSGNSGTPLKHLSSVLFTVPRQTDASSQAFNIALPNCESMLFVHSL